MHNDVIPYAQGKRFGNTQRTVLHFAVVLCYNVWIVLCSGTPIVHTHLPTSSGVCAHRKSVKRQGSVFSLRHGFHRLPQLVGQICAQVDGITRVGGRQHDTIR